MIMTFQKLRLQTTTHVNTTLRQYVAILDQASIPRKMRLFLNTNLFVRGRTTGMPNFVAACMVNNTAWPGGMREAHYYSVMTSIMF